MRDGVKEAQERSTRAACLLPGIRTPRHCHSNVLLQEGIVRGEWEMSSNGEQREKWYNWI